MRLLMITSLALVLSLSFSPFAQQRMMRMGDEPARPIDYSFPEGQDQVVVPLRVVGSAVLIPVTLSGGATFWVTLDTGMPADRALMLWDCPALDSLGLALAEDPNVRIGGAGGSGATFSPRIASSVTFKVGDLTIRDVELHALPRMKAPYQRDDGVIGRMLLANFVIVLDFDRSEMRLMLPGSYRAADGWSRIPLHYTRGVPNIAADIALTGGVEFPVELVLDLGAAHALSLYTDTDPRISVPDAHIETVTGYGISGPVLGQVARAASLTVGDQPLHNLICHFPRHDQMAGMMKEGNNGNLGFGALGRFNLVFDYADSALWIKPNGTYEKPFEYDMSGLSLQDDDSAFTVIEVLPNTPAAEAGVKKGDRIVMIDRKPVSTVPFLEFRERLKNDGLTIVLGVKRDNRTLTIPIALRRLI